MSEPYITPNDRTGRHEGQTYHLRKSGRRVVCGDCLGEWRIYDFANLTLAEIPCPECAGRLWPPNAGQIKAARRASGGRNGA
ncbi:MAG: hypothetical protein KC492_39805 [Myxococcales bacterium]|nr:hypothetical protein [Myxococcales bacterium]